jgi:ATP-dependent Clp protease ATP-binding subunit ClpB
MELKPTAEVAEALAIAQRSATAEANPEITPAHLGLAHAERPETTTPAPLAAGGTSAEAVAAAPRRSLATLPRTSGSTVHTPGLAQSTLQILQDAQTLVQAMGDTYQSTDALLLAPAEKGAVVADARPIEEQIPACAAVTRSPREPGGECGGAGEIRRVPLLGRGHGLLGRITAVTAGRPRCCQGRPRGCRWQHQNATSAPGAPLVP